MPREELLVEVFLERNWGFWAGAPESLGFFTENELPEIERESAGEGRLTYDYME